MTVVREVEFNAPARYEASNDGCDCYFHNRVFTHIGIGPVEPLTGDLFRPVLELPRRVHVQRYADGRNSRCMTITLDGAKIEIVRSVNPRQQWVWFGAWYGDPRDPAKTVRLSPHNDTWWRMSDGGDPTLIWSLPTPDWPAGSELVIWREAWWWHLVDGCDPLVLDVSHHVAG